MSFSFSRHFHSIQTSIRTFLTGAASLTMLGAGALLLMADSASCPDGYSDAKVDMSFTSTCPTDFAPKEGSLHFALPAGKDDSAQQKALADALRVAGIDAPGARVNQIESGGDSKNVCRPISFSLYRASPAFNCGNIVLGLGEQNVTCKSGSSATPLALRVGVEARDYNAPDGSTSAYSVGSTDGGLGDGEDRGDGKTSPVS